MKHKVLIIGDKPSARMRFGAKPFEGAKCEKRLMEWILFLELENFGIVNSNTGLDILGILNCYNSGYKLITLGNNAFNRLKKIGINSFKLPHPSFRNRKLNNKKYEKEQLELCKKWLKNS